MLLEVVAVLLAVPLPRLRSVAHPMQGLRKGALPRLRSMAPLSMAQSLSMATLSMTHHSIAPLSITHRAPAHEWVPRPSAPIFV